MAYEGIYHDPSDADDEFERDRSSFMSPTLPPDYESSPTESDPPSTEHTPTTYTHSTANAVSPRGLMTSWSEQQVADFVGSLGLHRYRGNLIGKETRKLGTFQVTDILVQRRESMVRPWSNYSKIISRTLGWQVLVIV